MPAGDTRPLGDVLRELGLDARRLGHPRARSMDSVVFARWPVSPSLALIYMTDNEDEGAPAWVAPARLVYGVRLVTMVDDPDRDWY